ncbi:MAG: hypothetical protein ACFFEK_00880 [Candidatus Thorarchaeota archaeon]
MTNLQKSTEHNFPQGVTNIRKSYWVSILLIFLLALFVTSFSTEPVVAEEEIVATRGTTITITATLLQNGSYGNPVPDQWIFFFDQTYNIPLGSAKTDTNGVAMISWSIPLNHTLGMTMINATFYGNDSLSLASSAQWTVLSILSATNITISQISDILAPGDTLTFSVHLTDDSSSSIPDATIAVFKNDTLLAKNKTDSSGETHFEIKCNSSWITLGDNNIRVVYSQDLDSFLDSSESMFTVNISKIATSIIPQSSHPNEIMLDESFNLYIELSDTNDSLPNELLEVTLDDNLLSYITSNSSGIAHFHTDIDERFTLGTHTLKIQYNGTERYSESYYEAYLTILTPVQLTVTLPESVEIGVIFEIEVSASDLLDRLIPDFDISILDITSNQRFTIPSSLSEITTIFEYELQGPPGVHILKIELAGNPFILDTSLVSNLTVWSKPEILLVACNVEHYASPDQEIVFEIQMNDWAGNFSLREIHLSIDGESHLSVHTNITGGTTLIFTAPSQEDQYNITISYNGNNALFELATKLDYSLYVTHKMPIRLELDFYEIVPSLRELSVHITVTALNGSTPQGITVSFNWLDSIDTIESKEGGIITLHLKIPATSGNHFLSYDSEESESVHSTSGSFLIEISASDIISLEGVGITGLVVVLAISIGLSIVPFLRRKYLVG